MRNVLGMQTVFTSSVVLLLCLILAAPALAQRPSLGGLQTEIDQNEANISTSQIDISTIESDITVNSDAICIVANAVGACKDIPFCVGSSACTKTVFLTDVAYDGDLGGLSGADAKCQDRANRDGLVGTYMAWLSDGANSPSTRFTRSTVPYVRVDGVTVADDWDDLTNGSIAAAIVINNNGRSEEGFVWTHTKADGTEQTGVAGDNACQDWTTDRDVTLGNNRGSLGTAKTGFDSFFWSEFGDNFCSLRNHLYCFQQ